MMSQQMDLEPLFQLASEIYYQSAATEHVDQVPQTLSSLMTRTQDASEEIIDLIQPSSMV